MKFTLLPALLAVGVAYAEEAPTGVKITSIGWSGSGCPQGSVKVSAPASSNGELTWSSSNFTARIGPDVAVSERTKNCQVHINFAEIPKGWQLSPDLESLKGYASLGTNVSAAFYITSFWSQDASATTTWQTQLSNTNSRGTVSRYHEAKSRVTLWSSCSAGTGILNVSYRVNLSSRDASSTGYFGVYESRTQRVATVARLGFKWRECSTEEPAEEAPAEEGGDI